MIVKAVASVFLVLTGFLSSAQNLIGYSESEIRKFMKENHNELTLNEVKNNLYKYLKYSDANESQTLLFFLNNAEVCRNIKLIYDRSLRTQKLKELDSMYRKKGENQWIDRRNGKKYLVESVDEKWAFTVTYK